MSTTGEQSVKKLNENYMKMCTFKKTKYFCLKMCCCWDIVVHINFNNN